LFLAIDVGNTRVHAGLFSGEVLSHHWHNGTRELHTGDDLSSAFAHVLSLRGLNLTQDVSGVALASVVPAVTRSLVDMADRLFGLPALVIGPWLDLGISISTDDPAQVGADRLVNAIAARRIAGNHGAIVVDAGTATKVDAVTPDGHFVGGAIAPGVTPAAGALAARAGSIPQAQFHAPTAAIGKSTLEALYSGASYGAAGMIDALVGRVRVELGGAPRVIATGGAAEVVAAHSSQIELVVPELTLTGIRLAAERN
jgi:type III pantothenate kinase